MGTFVRFALHDAGEQGYRAAFDVLSRIGFAAVEGPSVRGCPIRCRVFPALAVAELPGDPADHARAAFVALHEARLRPMGVTGQALAASALAQA